MAIQVMAPRQEPQKQEQKEDPWEKVLKGLQIAGGITGLAVDYQNFQQLRQQRELNDINLENQKQGLMTPGQVADLQTKGIQFTAPKGDQSDVRFRQGGEIVSAGLSIPKPEPKQDLYTTQVQRNGKLFDVTVDRLAGKELSAIEVGPVVAPKQETTEFVRTDPETGRRTKVIADASGKVVQEFDMGMDPKKEPTTARKETDYTTRVENIKANIKRLKDKIDDDGTFDWFGSHNQELDQMVQDIAVDYAKLVDPDSVARESEVENVKAMLKVTGLTTRDSTAIGALDNFLDQMETRINSKRIAQGMEPLPTTKESRGKGGPGTALAAEPTEEDKQAIEWARANPNDERAKEILKIWGMQ